MVTHFGKTKHIPKLIGTVHDCSVTVHQISSTLFYHSLSKIYDAQPHYTKSHKATQTVSLQGQLLWKEFF